MDELDCASCGKKDAHNLCKNCADKLRTGMLDGIYIAQWTRRSGNYPVKDLIEIENGLLFIAGDRLPVDKSWYKNFKGPITVEQIEAISK